jgi:cytochrome P450
MAHIHYSSLGERYQPLSPEFLADPYPLYELARKQEPIFFSPALNAYVVTRFRDVRAILAQPELFASSNVFRPLNPLHPRTLQELSKGYPRVPGTTDSDGERHDRNRASLNQPLSPAQVRLMEPRIQELAHELVDTFIDDGRVELISRYTKRLPLEVICGLYGIASSDLDNIGMASEAFFDILTAPDEQEQVEAAQKMVELHRLIASYVLHRRAEPQDDLISKITAARMPGTGPLTKEQEGDMAQSLGGLILAAHETISSTLGEAVKLLLSTPQHWQVFRQQPELIPNLVEELVRFVSPGHAFFRVATSDAVIGDESNGTALALPKGTQILLLYGSANHDETICPHAEQFDPRRSLKSNQHVGFGYGIHFCVGAHLARKEITIGLRTLMQRIPQMRLTPNQMFTYRRRLITRGLSRLEVEW